MDGLLIDSEPLWAAVEADFARSRGGDFTPELAARCVGRGLPHTLRFMSATFGFPVDLVRDADAIVASFIARARELVLKPGARALLDAAATGAMKVALGSSSTRRLVDASLAAVGETARFPVVVTGDDVTHTKPAPDIFLRCARELGVAPAACVVLEDSLAGVEAARAAGMRVIAVPERPNPAIASIADVVARDLHEASRVLGLTRRRDE